MNSYFFSYQVAQTEEHNVKAGCLPVCSDKRDSLPHDIQVLFYLDAFSVTLAQFNSLAGSLCSIFYKPGSETASC